MTTAKIDYQNYQITVEMPNAEIDNTMKVLVEKKEGTFNADMYDAYLKDWWQEGESDNSEYWLGEAVTEAVKLLNRQPTWD